MLAPSPPSLGELFLLVFIWLPQYAAAQPAGDLGDFATLVGKIRAAGLVVELRESRESSLLPEPLVSQRLVSFRMSDSWISCSQVLVSSAGEGVPRIVFLKRDDAYVRFNVRVTRDSYGSLVPSAEIFGKLFDGKVGEMPEEPSDWFSILSTAKDNWAAGLILGMTVEEVCGGFESPRLVEEEGQRTYEFRTRQGLARLSWSAASSSFPSKFIISKGPDDFQGMQKISSIQLNSGKGYPDGSVTSFVARISVDEFGTLPGTGLRHVPLKWVATHETHCTGGILVTERQEFSVVPDSQLSVGVIHKLGIQIPVGTRVEVEGASQLGYVWDGDWAVPAVDLLAASHLSSGNRNWPLILLLSFTCVVLLLIILYKKRSDGAA